ncbi:putative isomerase YbhE, partial [Exidia glandulosa HHB12029]
MVNFTILAGGYTAAISVFSFNTDTSKLSLVGTPSGGENPGWVQAAPGSKAVLCETGDGGVASFRVGSGGDLTQVSRGYSSGSPASLGVLPNGKEVVVANYDVGSVTSFPIGDDGLTLGDATPILQLEGSGPNPDRQTSPHPHHVVPYGDEVLIPDLGSDKVWRLVKGSSGGYEVAASVDMVPGSGPRH